MYYDLSGKEVTSDIEDEKPTKYPLLVSYKIKLASESNKEYNRLTSDKPKDKT